MRIVARELGVLDESRRRGGLGGSGWLGTTWAVGMVKLCVYLRRMHGEIEHVEKLSSVVSCLVTLTRPCEVVTVVLSAGVSTKDWRAQVLAPRLWRRELIVKAGQVKGTRIEKQTRRKKRVGPFDA